MIAPIIPQSLIVFNSWNSLRFQQAEIFLEFMKPTKAEDEPDAELVCLLVSVNSLNQANKVWLELSELMKPQPANQPQARQERKRATNNWVEERINSIEPAQPPLTNN